MPASFTLPRWLQWLLGLSPASAGEGTTFSREMAWLPAPWVCLVIVVACLGLVAWTYHQERNAARRWRMILLALIRTTFIAGLLFALTGFSLVPQRTGLPYLVLLLDDSQSMQIADRYDEDALREPLLDLLRRAQLTEDGSDDGIGDDTANNAQQGGSDDPNAPPATSSSAGTSSGPRIRRIDLEKSVLLADDARLLQELARRYKLRVYTVNSGAAGLTAPANVASGSAASGATSAATASADLDQMQDRLRDLPAEGPSTRLGQSVLEILEDLRGAPPAAIIVLTDGNTTDGENLVDAARAAGRQQVPLFTVGLGSTNPPQNLAASDLLVDDVVFVNDVVGFEFKLDATGLAGRGVDVLLKNRETGEQLARVSVIIDDATGSQIVRIPYRPTTVGDFEYVVEVAPLPEEADQADNRLTAKVSVRDEKIRVLLVQGFPSYEYRFLKHMLQRDSTIELNVVLQQGDRGFSQIDRSALALFPVRREELFSYDVILFSDVDLAYLGAQAIQNVHDFVTEKGGGIVFMAGPRFNPLEYRDTPIANLLPLEIDSVRLPTEATEEFTVRPTELGLLSPHMQLADSPEASREVWESLPTIRWFVEINALKPAARVLAEHPTRTTTSGLPLPLLIIQYVGAGKVLYHATDETHRWRKFDFQEVEFARYWVQTIRYLSRSKLSGRDAIAEVTTDRRKYVRGETVRFRVRFPDERQAPVDDDDVSLMLEREGGRQEQIPLRRNSINRGVFEGGVAEIAQGRYRAWLVSDLLEGQGPGMDFDVIAPPGEFEKTEMNVAELREAAQLTGGKYYDAPDSAQILDDLPEGRQIVVESLEPIPIWNNPLFIGLLLGLVCLEWLLRRSWGLL